jgi:hypothetical protein
MTPALQKFMKQAQEVHGTMIDVCYGLRALRVDIDKLTDKTKLPLHGTISTGSWNPESSNVIDSVTVDELRSRIGDSGYDETLIGNLCVAFIYALWEDKYREEFANERGVMKNDIQSDLFGDLGEYRRCIVHNHGSATSKMNSLKVLPQVEKGQKVQVTRVRLEKIIDEIKRELSRLSHPGSHQNVN